MIMEEIKDFKSIVTFTFHSDSKLNNKSNSKLGEIFVNLLKEKYLAEDQDQSTYGIPNVDLEVDDIRALCLDALVDNNYNYDSSDEVRLFKPIKESRLIMHKIVPFDVQGESSGILYNREIRRTKEINVNVNKS